MSLDLSSLNEMQLEAVKWQNGPLLVLAGPGSGKTRVLAYRIARLIDESADQYFRILGLTFTTKAAAEMRERISNLVPIGADRILLSTFHSFAGDILRQHGHLIGLNPDFNILSQDEDREAVLDEAIRDAGLDDETYSGKKLLPVIALLLDRVATKGDEASFLASINARNPEAIIAVYLAYRERMIKRNSMDFGCLIAEALRLLNEKPAVRRQIHKVYKYVCIDEFQDTNQSQHSLLTLLTNPDSKNLFVVADDDQIIYQWNGASPERLQNLRQEFQMSVLQLPQNYRCPHKVIEIANSLIAYNIRRSADRQQLFACKPAENLNPIRCKKFSTFESESEWIANDIANIRPFAERRHCVIIARARKLLDVIAANLEANGVSAHLAVRKDEWTSAQLRLLHGFLRLTNAGQDREQLGRVCRSFYRVEGINLAVVDVVSAAATYEGNYLRAFAVVALARAELAETTRTYLEKSFPKLSDRLEYIPFIDESFAWFDQNEDAQNAIDDEKSDYQEEKQTWRDLVLEINGQYGTDNVTLNVLLQELDLRSKAPKPPEGAVPCYTIHGSKGLEFHHVYLAGLVEDQLPSWTAVKKGDESDEMQEERRECFVAITRTEKTLTLTYSQKMQGWSKKPSRFLSEMGVLTSDGCADKSFTT